ncbi:S46 family peptidase [Dysgonomonas sp. 511]|uniref:S46 family peptidase n=1 Tax=Dysgonomonas sp. 511 TaxID=2302930 RepID=UPI0013CF73D9|nr:S46 family peptidase [Dysgonomonas sp. 511]NDV79450.1 S46 family peptidase [Dysgonomonas sp. 511]
MKRILLFFTLLLSVLLAKADEGMWLLKELNKQSAARMKELGFTFPIDNIYNENHPSLKDAVVIFGGGCTGVAVSQQGLIFTNHHCGYGDIQKLSSVEHDYLKDGFVSQTFAQELPAEGLMIQFLQKTEDITDFVTSTLQPGDSEDVRDQKIDSLSNLYLERYKDNEFLRAQVVPFYAHNKYYVVVYEVFKDVRLVFTPPSSVGKFGGETDNWMWPRHTGDFSVFRVYANKNNEAANYSADNVPYKPKYFVPVSLAGYKEKDYAMTIGYPGSTVRYKSSWGITQMVESEHKPRIEVRGAKQDIWKKAMNASDAIRIKYASKYARSSNYWKNAIGMNEAIAKLNVIPNKEKLELEFSAWAASDKDAAKLYGTTLPTIKDGYTSTMELAKNQTYLYETFYNGIEIVRMASVALFVGTANKDDKESELNKRLESIYKDYEPLLDRELTPVLLKLYAESVPADFLPAVYATITNKYSGDYAQYTNWLFDNTKLTSLEGAQALIKGTPEEIMADPAIQLAMSLHPLLNSLREKMAPYNSMIEKGEREFMAGLMKMQPDKAFYSDANFTQRLSYGSVGGYKPADAVSYNYYSTTDGVLQKENPESTEFAVQDYILNDIRKGDFGQYANKDGKMQVCFLSNNDITGGNSGSPVFNGKAELIGLAFDGNWEALSGDVVFEPELQRCINVDIRYVLYIIDKVMNCPRLIEELKVVQ